MNYDFSTREFDAAADGGVDDNVYHLGLQGRLVDAAIGAPGAAAGGARRHALHLKSVGVDPV